MNDNYIDFLHNLERLMVEHGACIRAKREMLVVERIPEHAGMFLVKTGLRTTVGVHFSGKKYYKSLKDVMSAIEKDDKLLCPQSP